MRCMHALLVSALDSTSSIVPDPKLQTYMLQCQVTNSAAAVLYLSDHPLVSSSFACQISFTASFVSCFTRADNEPQSLLSSGAYLHHPLLMGFRGRARLLVSFGRYPCNQSEEYQTVKGETYNED